MPTTRAGTADFVVAAVWVPPPVVEPPAVEEPLDDLVASAEPVVEEPVDPPAAVASSDDVPPATSPAEPSTTPFAVRRRVPEVLATDFTSKLFCTAMPATEA